MLRRRRPLPGPSRVVIRNPLLFESDPDVPVALRARLNSYAELRMSEGFADTSRAGEAADRIRADWAAAGLEPVYLAAIFVVLDYQVIAESLGELGDRLEAGQRLGDFWVAHGMDKRLLRKIVNRIDLNVLSIIDG